MLELVKAGRIVGWNTLMRLRRTQRLAWPGMLSGFITTRAMQTLFHVGFFDELQRNGRATVDDFALANNLDSAILKSLCEALYSWRLLDTDGDAYTLSPDGRLLVEMGRGWFDAVY